MLRLRKGLKPSRKGRAVTGSGLQLDWNSQLYAFVKIQLKAEVQWKQAELKRGPTEPITPRKSGKERALLVAQAGGWGTWVMHQILRQEVYYIRNGKLPAPKQGKHVKVASWLPDQGTIMAMQEYMKHAGEGKLI